MFQLQDEIEKKFRDKLKEEGRSGGSVVPSTPFDRVINQANVVCGTLSSMAHLAKKQSSRNNTTSPNCGVDLFDVVIIDEASQAVEPATLIPLQWLKPDGLIVLVGDCQQLGPAVIFAPRSKPTTPRVCSNVFKKLDYRLSHSKNNTECIHRLCDSRT